MTLSFGQKIFYTAQALRFVLCITFMVAGTATSWLIERPEAAFHTTFLLWVGFAVGYLVNRYR